jgi:hypothetical protein
MASSLPGDLGDRYQRNVTEHIHFERRRHGWRRAEETDLSPLDLSGSNAKILASTSSASAIWAAGQVPPGD